MLACRAGQVAVAQLLLAHPRISAFESDAHDKTFLHYLMMGSGDNDYSERLDAGC